MDTIHLFLGTKAQYIKTAPLVRVLVDRRVDHRLIDSGQHARLSVAMRRALGVRDPDVVLGGDDDVASPGAAVVWSARLARPAWSAPAVRRDVFDGRGGVCVVHGDTPSTVLAALLARRAGLVVAHIEAGLRSHSYRHPFPEEAIRVAVMHLAHRLYAPDATAMGHLRAMGLADRAVPVGGNTTVEALAAALRDRPSPSGPAVATLHRVENLASRTRIRRAVRVLEGLAQRMPVHVVAHRPTEAALRRLGLRERLVRSGVRVTPLVSHRAFVALLASAPLVITDGGSVQEECALLGVPTLLWRARSERPDGLGANVVLSRYRADTIAGFLASPERYRRPCAPLDRRPSAQIADDLVALLGSRRPALAG